jgi:hypothetical protein
VLWALMLGLPGWNSLDVLLMEHTSFVATCVLGFFWMLVRYTETAAPRHFYGLALLYALSLHAHPSTYALALVACRSSCGPGGRGGKVARPRDRRARVPGAVRAFSCEPARRGIPDIRGAFDYLATTAGSARCRTSPP